MYDRDTIKRYIRRISREKSKKREVCYICQKHRFIAQCHHVIPVSEIADYIEKTGLVDFIMPTIWLCPNHHVYMHSLDQQNNLVILNELLDFSDKERERYQHYINFRNEARKRFGNILEENLKNERKTDNAGIESSSEM